MTTKDEMYTWVWLSLVLSASSSLSQEDISSFFPNNTVTNVTVQLATTAFLYCKLPVVGDRSVVRPEHTSWIRRRDWHILSSGPLTFTNDERFQVLHQDEDYTLQIKYVQQRDEGAYECQISTSIGQLSHFVNLMVVVPEASIDGSVDRHVDVGSRIKLICRIRKSPTPPQYIFWYRNNNMLNYGSDVTITISTTSLTSPESDTSSASASIASVTSTLQQEVETLSTLIIEKAKGEHSGNYSCGGGNTKGASVNVFVQQGDKMASLRRKSSASLPMFNCFFVICFSFFR